MRSFKTLLIVGLILAVSAPAWSAVYINDFAATRQTWFGSGLGTYASNSNYSSLKFGRVCKINADQTMFDVNHAAMSSWVQGFFTAANVALTDPNQFGNGAVNVTMYMTAYDSWENSTPAPPTVFGHYFWPGVRLSKNSDLTGGWVETVATFQSAGGAGYPWRDKNGGVMSDLYQHLYNTSLNMVLNATSEQWGEADTIGGGVDVYGYDTPRPWVLDNTVAWAALENPNAIGFQMVSDYKNKPWETTGAEDDCVGTVYGRLHGLTEYRPYVEITVNTSKIGPPPASHTYLPADFNQDLKVSFADYLILEANFGKSGKTNATGDANNDGKVSFADYLILEAEFGHTTTPEPATIGLLVVGGLTLARRRK